MPTKREEKDKIIEEKFTFCLIPECGKLQGDKGVCDAHRKGIQEQVDEGKITWESYAEYGFARLVPLELDPAYPRDGRCRIGPQKTCLAPGCDFLVLARGLCMNHYQTCRRLVRKKQTTWKMLEEHGFAVSSTWSDSNQAFRENIAESGAIKPHLEEVDRHIGRMPPSKTEVKLPRMLVPPEPQEPPTIPLKPPTIPLVDFKDLGMYFQPPTEPKDPVEPKEPTEAKEPEEPEAPPEEPWVPPAPEDLGQINASEPTEEVTGGN